MISTGEPAPEFTIPGTVGTEIEQYSLGDYTARGAVVLVFYPFDFSPVCTKELCELRDTEWLTLTEDVDVFGISRDSCYAHQQFIRENDFSFPLLSDTQGQVIEDYGIIYDEWEHHQGVPKRALVTIDDTQTVRYTWKTENAYEAPTLDELHQTVTSLTP